jgi:hypothetical protein
MAQMAGTGRGTSLSSISPAVAVLVRQLNDASAGLCPAAFVVVCGVLLISFIAVVLSAQAPRPR